MKRRISAVLLALALCMLAPYALAANRVTNIDIGVLLEDDGSAWIKQIWSGRFSEGTECYIPISDSGYLAVEDLTVSMGGNEEIEFESLDDWDVDASFDDKAYRCGIHRTGDGYELCWGISEYGEQTFAISYHVRDLVRSFDEADGFNFMFVNPGMNTTPTDVTVWIEAENYDLSVDNSAAWAFGFTGEIQFEEGGVYAWTEDPISGNDRVIIMLEMNPDMLSPRLRADGSFETMVKQPAMDGSDYDDGEDGSLIGVLCAIGAAVVGLVVWAIVHSVKRKKRIDEILHRYGTLDACPTEGNLIAAWQLGRLFGFVKEEGSVIGAMLLRLLRDGCLVPERQVYNEKEIAQTALYFDHAPEDYYSNPEAWLYDCLLRAGDGSGRLTAKSAKRYFSLHDDEMRALVDHCESEGSAWLCEHGCFTDNAASGSFKKLTEAGEREIARLLLMERLLTDGSNDSLAFYLSPEDCYAYALLFDLKDKTLAQIRRFYPEMDTDWNELDSFYWYSMYYYDYSYGEMHRVEEERRSEGSGGSSSSSGGGGFSGGGSGGGTR